MIILRHNTLSAQDLFSIETAMLKISENDYEYTLDYSLLNKPRCEIYGYIGGIFKRMKVCQTLGITTSEFLDFLIDVEKGYNNNPYHSFYHAVDITMVLYHMLNQFNISDYLTDTDLALLLMAALCHDIGHPGKNNHFEICCKTKSAKQFKNLSVLESQSCVMTLKLLDKHTLLRNLDSVDEKKSFIVRMILATDMMCHSTLQENILLLHEIIQLDPTKNSSSRPILKRLYKEKEEITPFCYFKQTYFMTVLETSTTLSDQQKLNQRERLMLCKILIHAADISNPCRPWKVFHELSRLVCTEFFSQGEQESKLGLSISPNMDSTKCNANTINLGFIDYIVKPYFETLCILFPKCQLFIDECYKNRGELTLLKEEKVTITTTCQPLEYSLPSPKEHILKRRKSEDIEFILKKHRRTTSRSSSIANNRRRKSEILFEPFKNGIIF